MERHKLKKKLKQLRDNQAAYLYLGGMQGCLFPAGLIVRKVRLTDLVPNTTN